MLIAEELFLLLRRDDGKPESAMAYRAYGLAAALVTDLVVAGRLRLSDDKDPRVSVLAQGPLGHPALDTALARLEQRDGKRLSSLVADRKVAREEELAAALAAAGVIRVEERRALGLVPERYPVVDPEPERRTRERLRTVLAGGTPTPADASVLAILQGLGIAPKVLEEEKGSLDRKELERRIEEVSADVAARDAVARAVAAMSVAVMTAVVFPVVSSGS